MRKHVKFICILISFLMLCILVWGCDPVRLGPGWAVVRLNWAVYKDLPAIYDKPQFQLYTFHASNWLDDEDIGDADVNVEVDFVVGNVTRGWDCGGCESCCGKGNLNTFDYLDYFIKNLRAEGYLCGVAKDIVLLGNPNILGVAMFEHQAMALNGKNLASAVPAYAAQTMAHELGHLAFSDKTMRFGRSLFDLHPDDPQYGWLKSYYPNGAPQAFIDAWNSAPRGTWSNRLMHWSHAMSAYMVTDCPVNGDEKAAYENWAARQ